MNQTQPYTVYQKEDHPLSPYPVSIYGDDGVEIAAVKNHGTDTAQIARTLAASPALLDALVSVRAWVAQYLEVDGHRHAAADRLRMIDRAIDLTEVQGDSDCDDHLSGI